MRPRGSTNWRSRRGLYSARAAGLYRAVDLDGGETEIGAAPAVADSNARRLVAGRASATDRAVSRAAFWKAERDAARMVPAVVTRSATASPAVGNIRVAHRSDGRGRHYHEA